MKKLLIATVFPILFACGDNPSAPQGVDVNTRQNQLKRTYTETDEYLGFYDWSIFDNGDSTFVNRKVEVWRYNNGGGNHVETRRVCHPVLPDESYTCDIRWNWDTEDNKHFTAGTTTVITDGTFPNGAAAVSYCIKVCSAPIPNPEVQ